MKLIVKHVAIYAIRHMAECMLDGLFFTNIVVDSLDIGYQHRMFFGVSS